MSSPTAAIWPGEDLIQLLWQLPASTATEDITDCCRLLSNETGDEILLRLQRPNELVLDSIKNKFFVANDHNKAAAAYQSPHSNEWFTKDGKHIPFADMPTGVQRLEELPSTAPLRTEFRNLMAQYFHFALPLAYHSEYLWELSSSRCYGLAVLTKLLYNIGELSCELDLVQTMTLTIGNASSELIQLKTLGYVTLKDTIKDFEITGKCIDKSEHSGLILRQNSLCLNRAQQTFQTAIETSIRKLMCVIPKGCVESLMSLRSF